MAKTALEAAMEKIAELEKQREAYVLLTEKGAEADRKILDKEKRASALRIRELLEENERLEKALNACSETNLFHGWASEAIRRFREQDKRIAALEAHLREITRRFKAVAIHTRDDRDYDLTYLAGAIQDARSALGEVDGG